MPPGGWRYALGLVYMGRPFMLPALLAFVLLQAPLAAPGGPAEQERFKAYFTKGESLYGAGEYGAAIWNFRKADTIRLTPEVVYDLAKCHEKLGDVAFTTYYFRQYLKRAPNASDALSVAERVGVVLAQAEAEGRGLLEVVAPGAEQITIGTRTFTEAPAVLFLPPGEFEVSASFSRRSQDDDDPAAHRQDHDRQLRADAAADARCDAVGS